MNLDSNGYVFTVDLGLKTDPSSLQLTKNIPIKSKSRQRNKYIADPTIVIRNLSTMYNIKRRAH